MLDSMKRRFTEDSWRREPWLKSLVAALKSMRSELEMENFLRDIATLSELQALSERLEIARLLAKGLSYRAVAKQTGASTTTVTRVAHVLENGQGAYRSLLRTHRHHRLRKPVLQIVPEDGVLQGEARHNQQDFLPMSQGKEIIPALIEDKKTLSPLHKYLEHAKRKGKEEGQNG